MACAPPKLEPVSKSPLLALKRGSLQPEKIPDSEPEPTVDDFTGGRDVVCLFCRNKITTTGARISIADRHDHTFINPGGWEYRIGCFAKALGCRQQGEISTYWSWFEGYSWQMNVCGQCGEHLGWLFRGEEDQFHGLILNRLLELDDDAGRERGS